MLKGPGREFGPKQPSDQQNALFPGLQAVALALLNQPQSADLTEEIKCASPDDCGAAALVYLHHKIAAIGQDDISTVTDRLKRSIWSRFDESQTVPRPSEKTIAQIEQYERNAIAEEIASKQGAASYRLPLDLVQGARTLEAKILSAEDSLGSLRTAELFHLLTHDSVRPFTFEAARAALNMAEHRPGLSRLLSHFLPELTLPPLLPPVSG